MPAKTNRLASTARHRFHVAPTAAAALLLAGLASGCAAPDDQFAPACPSLSLVPGASDITRFAGSGRDPADMVLHAQIAAVPAKCVRDGTKSIKSTLNVQADMTRGIAAHGPTPPLTYFIAVTQGDKVLQEQDFALVAQFPSNSDRISIKGDDIELLVPVSKTKSAAAYHIYVGFRLTQDELAYNRSHHMQ